jgi:Helix-hairpin-helix domain
MNTPMDSIKSNRKLSMIANNEKNQGLIDALISLSYHLEDRKLQDRYATFKYKALQTAAANLANLSYAITDGSSLMCGRTKVKGIGKGTAYYINEYVKTGRLAELDRYDSVKSISSPQNSGSHQFPIVIKSNELSDPVPSSDNYVVINRAPVLSLWVKVVAMKQGYNEMEALSYSRWITGLLANAKGKSLGYKTHHYHKADVHDGDNLKSKKQRLNESYIQVFQDIKIPIQTDVNGNRIAVESDGVTMINAQSNDRYIQQAFGIQYQTVQSLMQELADDFVQYRQQHHSSLVEDDPLLSLRRHAYELYETFRPEWKGWAEKSILDFNKIRSLILGSRIHSDGSHDDIKPEFPGSTTSSLASTARNSTKVITVEATTSNTVMTDDFLVAKTDEIKERKRARSSSRLKKSTIT